MYAWKCWRDTRARFTVYLILAVLIAVFCSVVSSMVHFPQTSPSQSAAGKGPRPTLAPPVLRFRRGGDRTEITRAWDTTASVALGGFCSLAIALAGLGLGASGVGEEFEQRTLEFLLTRPRRRKYFVWVGWAACVSELLLIVVSAVLAAFVILIYVTQAVLSWKFLAMTLPLSVLAAATFSLTYFMSVLTRSTRTGLSLGMGIVLIDVLIPALVSPWALRSWRRHFPSLVDLFSGGNWTLDPTAHFPFVAAVGWSLFAVALVFATELIFERAEV